ncbi:MAG: enoyl-CoA hydratase [Tepidimonas sp.]|uniref:enoyl-CoA hydratase n=1 Tax=Tepidimonas sp. TaxID=2002775 RepID=UPI00298EE83A|nr:enoyl-CoA hydratase [Tepidimonas sp.]MDW8336084.1 enoyl-CoA hydratase [Tepidimonas sp.]
MTSAVWPGLHLQRQNAVALLTLDHPPANTWTLESLQALRAVIDELQSDSSVRALILTGAGPRFFSAGADLKLFAPQQDRSDPAIATAMAQAFGQAFEALANFPGITIAAINGYAMGGGLECALACDLRVVEEQATLALPEARVGLLPCAGGTQWLAWLVGESWAKRMILLGEQIDAPTAMKIGLADAMVAQGQAVAHAMTWAEKVLRQSPSAVRACKRLIQGARSLPAQHWLPAEREAFVALFATPEPAEGVRAFLDKREPHWTRPLTPS